MRAYSFHVAPAGTPNSIADSLYSIAVISVITCLRHRPVRRYLRAFLPSKVLPNSLRSDNAPPARIAVERAWRDAKTAICAKICEEVGCGESLTSYWAAVDCGCCRSDMVGSSPSASRGTRT